MGIPNNYPEKKLVLLMPTKLLTVVFIGSKPIAMPGIEE
jgi:hypothetical protein